MRLLLLLVFISFSFISFAQTPGWNTPQNLNLYNAPDRFEDVYFIDTNLGFTAHYSGTIYKTRDGADHWSLVFGGSSKHVFRSIEFLGDGKTGITGALDQHIFRTADTGNTWTEITNAIPDTVTSFDARKICGLAHVGNNFYGVGWWGSSTARFYKSTDKGISWTTKYIDTALATNLVDVYFTSVDTGFAAGGKSKPNPNYLSNEAVILKTTDGGSTWKKVFSDKALGGRIWKIQYLNAHCIVGSIEPYYYPDTVNMVKSTDGGNTWTTLHVGKVHQKGFYPPTGAITQGIGFATEKIGWLGGWYQGIFETRDSGKHWDTIGLSENWNRIFVLDSTCAFAGAKTIFRYRPYKDTVKPVPPVDTTHGTDTLKSQPKYQNTPAPNLSISRPPHDLYPIHPNPARNDVGIKFDIKSETNVVLEVVNVDQKWHQQLFREWLKPGHYEYTWKSDCAPPGNYLVWLGTDLIPIVQKFVLLK